MTTKIKRLQMLMVPLDDVLGDDVKAPRKLLESIAQIGQIDPVLAVVEGARWRIISGHRRAAAMRELNLAEIKLIPCADAFEAERLKVALASNVHSKNKPGEARLLAELGVKEPGDLDDDTRRAIGLSAAEVRERLSLLKLGDDILALVERGELSIEAGKALAKLPNATEAGVNQATALERAQELAGPAKRITVKAVRRAVREARGQLQKQLPIPASAFKHEAGDGPRVDPVAVAGLLRKLRADAPVIVLSEWDTVILNLEQMAG